MKDNLEQGANLLVSPGGIAEIYEASPTQVRRLRFLCSKLGTSEHS